MILVDLGRFWWVAGLEGLATCGGLWQPVGRRSHPIQTSNKQEDSMPRAWRPLGVRRLVNDDWRLLGMRRLVNDDKQEDWRDFSHARA